MKTLDKYIAKNFIKSFIVCLLAFEGIFVISQLFKIVGLVSNGKLTNSEAVRYIITMLPKITMNVTPIAVLLGSLMTISVMASNLEIISFKTSGISFRRVTRMPVIIAGIIAVCAFIFNDKVLPAANKKNKEIRNSELINRTVPLEKSNAFLRGSNGNYVYLMKNINRETGFGEDVEIVDLNKDFTKRERIITATEARYNFSQKQWILKNAYIYNDTDKISGENVPLFTDPKYNDEPDKFIMLKNDPRTLNIKELKKTARDIRSIGGDIKEIMYELGRRYSFPFASFIIVFLGLALGSRYVRGTSAINIALSVCFGYGYYVIMGVFEAYSKNGLLNPFVAGWIPNIIFLILGLYLMTKAEH